MISRSLRLMLLSGAAIAATGTAHAQSASTATTAGTEVSNTATVTYAVNGASQTTTSNTAKFVVDRKVDFTVITDQTGATQVNLSQQAAVTKFKVTNHTNGVQDFWLDPDQTTLSVGILTGTDDFDISTMKVFVDSNNNGVYDVDVDTQTYIDELAPEASVAVFIVGNIPSTVGIHEAQVSLHVIAAAGGASGTKGSLLAATDLNLGNADNVVDIVFADDDSDAALNLGDIARNGQGRAYAAYVIGTQNVALTVTKSALILSDGVNTLNPKALPGATVQYCLLVHNGTALTGANGVALTDVVPSNTTYVPGSISVGLPGGTCVLAGTTEDDDSDDTAETDGFTANYNGGTQTVTANVGTVAGLGSLAVAFKVTIN
ncbi:hypothetical protein [Sphingobium sp. Z007]|uniref:hypothetical protein n=1 Tax=Sphingobium sp. Z007 TaxID=627495 RepID=UPI0020CCEC95|nr:hypothetical protein [Sphingobium sp. Z007]